MKSKWTCILIAFVLGFTTAWTVQAFRIGHMENVTLAREVGASHEAGQAEADKVHDELMQKLGEFVAHGKKRPTGE